MTECGTSNCTIGLLLQCPKRAISLLFEAPSTFRVRLFIGEKYIISREFLLRDLHCTSEVVFAFCLYPRGWWSDYFAALHQDVPQLATFDIGEKRVIYLELDGGGDGYSLLNGYGVPL